MAKIWDALTGRRSTPRDDFDGLFSLPAAAITLQTSADFTMSGTGAICFRSAEGPAFEATLRDVIALLDHDDDPDVERVTDDYGFTWIVARQTDLQSLVTDLHAVSTALEAQGFASSLLCAMVPFADSTGRRFGLVYHYKRGTFYPFSPMADGRRDNVLEIWVRDLLSTDLPLEKQLGNWMALWGAPGL